MAGIHKVDNRISINNEREPYGGQVVDLQYSISFEGSSSVALTVASASGGYSTPVLNSENPVIIDFGPYKMKVLPTSYRTSKGSGGRTLTVNYDDMSIKYLDKNNILLRYQQLDAPRGGATLVLGVTFADDENGVSRRYYGKWIPGGSVRVQYDIRDVAEAINDHGIPISEKFFDYLKQFKAYVKGSDKISAPASFLRSDVGSIRSVLGAIAGELGFVFFWNNEDAIKEPPPGSVVRGIKNKRKGEGFLDFVTFKTSVDINQINQVSNNFSKSCNVIDDSSEVSIKESFLKGGIGYFAAEPPQFVGKSARFSRFKFQEQVTSKWTGESVHISQNYGLELLMRAAIMGGDYYKKYVMQKLTASYMTDMSSVGTHQYLTLKQRNQPELKPNVASRISSTIREESAEDVPLNMEINEAVDALYKGPEFDMVPLLYSKHWTGGDSDDWRAEYTGGQTQPNSPEEEAEGASACWDTIFDDGGFVTKLRGEYQKDGEEGEENKIEASEFVGVIGRSTFPAEEDDEGKKTLKRATGLAQMLEDVESDPVYKQLKFLAEHYGTIFFQGTRTSGKLITQQLFDKRAYAEGVEWVFSDTACHDTPLGEIFTSTQGMFKKGVDGKKEDSLYKKRGVYEIMKDGQSVCGRPSNLPGNVLSPAERLYRVGKDNLSYYPEDEEEAEGYGDIMGIYTFLGKTTDIIQSGAGNPKQTGCARGQEQENEIQPMYNVSSSTAGGFVLETLRRRATTEIEFGDDEEIREQVGGRGKSITNEHYQQVQSYRQSCDRIIHPEEALTSPTTRSEGEDPDTEAQFNYPTDMDYGVVIHKAGRGAGVSGGDAEMSWVSYTKSNDANLTDLWYNDEATLIAMEVSQEEVDDDYHSSWGKKTADFWDIKLLEGVTVNVSLNTVESKKYISYSLTLDEYLQSLRAAYVADSASEVFGSICSVQIEDVPFDMGSLLDLDSYKYEYRVCEGGSEREAILDLQKAGENLLRIMADYVEINASPSISRDFVVSGYGFKEGLDGEERLPTIYQGLESIGMQLTDQGIQTTVKIGNKRRMRASSQLRAQMIVKGMPGGTASRAVPNQITNSFSTGLQARL